MTLAIALLLAVFLGPLIAYRGRMQATTLWIGKRLSDPDSSYSQQVVIQSAVTPKSQDRWNGWWFVIPVLIAGLGFYHAWWGGFPALVALIIAMVIAEKLIVPQALEHYLQLILTELQNRFADYVRDGDHLRADAMETLLPQVEVLLDQARTLNLPALRVVDVRAMPPG